MIKAQKNLLLALVSSALLVFSLSVFAEEPPTHSATSEHAQPATGEADHATGTHAEGHGAHVPTEIPKVVYYQALNLSILIIGLAFLLRSKVSNFFSGRHEKLAAAVNEARRAQQEAEHKHQDYQVRLQSLEKSAAEQLQSILKEGEVYKKRLIDEAKIVAANIDAEAKRAAANEIEKAKIHLKEELVNHSLELARKALTDGVKENDQQRLQKEFVEKIGVARS